jgi:hypothetical protein
MIRAAGRIAAVAALALGGIPASAQIADRVAVFAQLPHWPGYWVSEDQAGTTITGLAPVVTSSTGGAAGFAGIMALRGDGAAWNEEGLRRRAAMRAVAGGRKALGWGYPMMMNCATPLAFIITPEMTVITNAYNETRYIYTDGRPMPSEDDMWPTTWGTSVGHWEGDTLVVETRMVKNPADFFHGAPPFSEEAVYVERIHNDGARLLMDMTVTDPVTLNEPFHAQISWVRDEGFDRMVQVDWDNDRTGSEDGLNTIELESVGN